MTELMDLFAADAADVTNMPSEEKIATAQQMCTHLAQVDASIRQMESDLQALKDERKEIVQRKLPTYMDSIGLDKLGIPEFGVDMVVEPYYHANIPPEREAEAFAWLETNGHGSLIKLSLTVQLQRGDYDFGKRLLERIETYLAAHTVKATVTSKLGVPWNTLTAFVREQVEAGMVLPLDILGATVGRIVKIKQRKN